MRVLLLICVPLLFSCTKCADCTTTWKYKEYHTNHNGVTWGYRNWDGAVESERVCGSDEIKAAQKGKTSKTETRITNADYVVVEGTGTCKCITR